MKGDIFITGLKSRVFNGNLFNKAFALGADAVLIGRGILPELLKDGQAGTEAKIEKLNEELSQMMLYTGIPDTKSFDRSILHFE